MSVPDWDAHHTTEQQRQEWAPGTERPDALKRQPILDQPTDPHPILDELLNDALTIIILTSDGAVMPLKERTTGSHAGTIAPTSSLAGLVDEIAGRYQRCVTNRARLLVVHEAQRVADRLRFAPRSEQRGTTEWKRAIGLDDRPSRVVASVYGVSKRDVSAYRKTYR